MFGLAGDFQFIYMFSSLPVQEGIDLITKFDAILAIIEVISTSYQFYPSG